MPYTLSAVCLFCLWLIWNSLSPALPIPSEPPKFYSNPSRQDLRLTLLKAIHQAKESIFLCMFGLNDPSILRALSDKIHENIPTLIYYDAKGSPDVRKTLEGAEVHPVLLSGIMHQKVLILDEEIVFLGSTNFTPPSLRMHDNLVIGFASQKIAHFLKEKTPYSSGYLKTAVGGQNVELWLLPDPKGHILTDLKRKIRKTTKSLQIALFTLTHRALIDEIIQAKKRKVEVEVVLDLHSALGASREAVELLGQADIPVFLSQGVQLMHHKFAYLDHQMLITGSANWTKAAFAKNSDCLFILHSLNQEQKHCMDQMWGSLKSSSKRA